MNLGKPRRRLTVAERPSVDLDAHFGIDAPAESDPSTEHESTAVAGGDREDAAADGGAEH
jgi:hypothetical protein